MQARRRQTEDRVARFCRLAGQYPAAFDGADGEGLDVIAGSVTPSRAVLTLKRKQLDGAMLARLASKNQLNITVSVTVGETLVPVIGMKLDRVNSLAENR